MINQYMKEAEKLIKFKAHEAHTRLLPHWQLEDLEQEGRVAALRAARKYKKETGTLFTTFIFPYLSRTYLSIYAHETCPKRSIHKQILKDLEFMENKKIIFPASYQRGTIYNLDRIFQENDVLSDWKEQPVLQEQSLQTRSVADEYEEQNLFEELFKRIDEVSRTLLLLIINPPPDFSTHDTSSGKIPSKYYCEYLHISQHKLNKLIKNIKREVRRLSETRTTIGNR